MNALFLLGDGLQRLALLAVAEEGLGTVLLMFAVFAALVVLIGLMTVRRKRRPSQNRLSAAADPFTEARRDEPVEAMADQNFRR